MYDPWTWTTGWGLTVGVGGGLGQGEQRGKDWDNCNRTTIIYILFRSLVYIFPVLFSYFIYTCKLFIESVLWGVIILTSMFHLRPMEGEMKEGREKC